jgi:uncharacterized membrane protein YkvA (DUF1232 family)
LWDRLRGYTFCYDCDKASDLELASDADEMRGDGIVDSGTVNLSENECKELASVRSLRDPDSEVQQAAKKALIQAGPEVSDAVKDGRDDRDVRGQNLRADALDTTEPVQQAENTGLSLTRTCLRCNSLFEIKRTVSRVLCDKCVRELDIAAVSLYLPIRACIYCKKEFKPNSESQRFCSKSCSAKARYETGSKREGRVPPPPAREGPAAVYVAKQTSARQVSASLRACEYCKKTFRPDNESQRFCSYSCSSKALSEARSKQEERVPPPSVLHKGPGIVHVAEQSGDGRVGPSARRLELYDVPDWSFNTFLSKRVAQYGGQYKEIVASAVPFYNLLCELLNDALIDWYTKIMISSALGYLVLADDAIPDRSENGLIDDIFVMAYVLQEIKKRFSSKPIERNWHLDEDVCTMVDATCDACNDLIRSQKFEILAKVGLHKFESLDLEEYSGSYQKRLGKVGREKRELLGLLAYVVRKMDGVKVDRSSVEKIRSQIEQSGDAAEINRIIELAKRDHQIEVRDKEMEDFKENFHRKMNEQALDRLMRK